MIPTQTATFLSGCHVHSVSKQTVSGRGDSHHGGHRRTWKGKNGRAITSLHIPRDGLHDTHRVNKCTSVSMCDVPSQGKASQWILGFAKRQTVEPTDFRWKATSSMTMDRMCVSLPNSHAEALILTVLVSEGGVLGR